jgi:hypothetical protein
MLDTEISVILAVARACVWANRVDLIEGALHETCHQGKAAGLEYLRAHREGELMTGARQMRPAVPEVTNDQLAEAIAKRFKAQNARG